MRLSEYTESVQAAKNILAQLEKHPPESFTLYEDIIFASHNSCPYFEERKVRNPYSNVGQLKTEYIPLLPELIKRWLKLDKNDQDDIKDLLVEYNSAHGKWIQVDTVKFYSEVEKELAK